jgi:DNA modification methylase
MKIEQLATGDLIPYVNNSRTHDDKQVGQIAASIKEFGFTNPILIDNENGIIAGHGRLQGAQKLGIEQVPCIRLGDLTEAQKKAYVIADNKLALNAGWDMDLLAVEIEGLKDLDFDVDLLGFDADELDITLGDDFGGDVSKGKLSDRFMIPPFSVFNAREGWWQDRKRMWIGMGIKSELGRGENTLGFSEVANKGGYAQCLKKGIGEKYNRKEMTGTSIFDPVLCEIAYRWFSPVGGLILDPFAGGSVRGIVAAKLGRDYIGHELRGEQVEANRAQAEDMLEDNVPVWITGDSRNIDKTCVDVQADFIFSCPPYADLEVYSDDPNDLSTLAYEDFRDSYFEIIKKSCALLKEDRFACFVVGEVRDKKGGYYNFVGDTIKAFTDAGLTYYNEAILVTAIGSLPIRAGKTFEAGRKLGKTHQNILVFVKGDSKKATQYCGVVDVDYGSIDED